MDRLIRRACAPLAATLYAEYATSSVSGHHISAAPAMRLLSAIRPHGDTRFTRDEQLPLFIWRL